MNKKPPTKAVRKGTTSNSNVYDFDTGEVLRRIPARVRNNRKNIRNTVEIERFIELNRRGRIKGMSLVYIFEDNRNEDKIKAVNYFRDDDPLTTFQIYTWNKYLNDHISSNIFSPLVAE